MTDYKFGDIVLVPFPFTDQTTTKRRPAVIVSSNGYNQDYAVAKYSIRIVVLHGDMVRLEPSLLDGLDLVLRPFFRNGFRVPPPRGRLEISEARLLRPQKSVKSAPSPPIEFVLEFPPAA